jgi:hypothetical protein
MVSNMQYQGGIDSSEASFLHPLFQLSCQKYHEDSRNKESICYNALIARYHHSCLQPSSVYRWHIGSTIDDVIYTQLSLKVFWICVCKRKLWWKFCCNRSIVEVTTSCFKEHTQYMGIFIRVQTRNNPAYTDILLDLKR